MSQGHSSATEAAQRLGRRDWMEPAEKNRKKWGRKRTVAVIVGGAVFASGVFIISDGPRVTGMTEAMGWTCGEYVHPGALEPSDSDQPWRGEGHPQEFFETWEDQVQRLQAHAAEDEEYGSDAVAAFVEEVESLAQDNGLEPTFGAFRGWSPTRGGFSATAGESSVILAEHLETQSSSDRVSLISPESGEARISAALEHPQREHWEDREPVLYGVGEADSELVLQTPTDRGNTDVVVVGADLNENPECIRLEGGFAPTRYQEGYPTAWHSVMDLGQVQNRDEDSFLIIHGRDVDGAGSPHMISAVDIATEEAETFAGNLEWEEASEMELAGFEVSGLEELGEGHYFLDWGYGYIIFGPGS